MIRSRTITAISVALAAAGCAPPGPRMPADSLESKRASIQVAAPLNAKVSYLKAGDADGVPMILIHGTPGEATGWTDYLMEPMKRATVIALDRPGFGESGPDDAVIALDAQAAAVAALLPSDGRKAVIVGHSLGGAVAAWVAAAHPDRVQAVVLLASSLDPSQESIHPMQYVGDSFLFSWMLPRAVKNANTELMAFKPQLERLAPMLGRITAPVIIVHGTKDDLVPFANVAYMQRMLTGAQCVETIVLDGQNHFLPWNSEPTVRRAMAWAIAGACGTP
jgi:pimeloyl-ACP methyl ester carboxylesterase